MFRVEIRLADEDRLVAMVTAMRAWLDEHGIFHLENKEA